MVQYFSLNDGSGAVIVKVLKPFGGGDKYKLYSNSGDDWLDDISGLDVTEITEEQYTSALNMVNRIQQAQEEILSIRALQGS